MNQVGDLRLPAHHTTTTGSYLSIMTDKKQGGMKILAAYALLSVLRCSTYSKSLPPSDLFSAPHSICRPFRGVICVHVIATQSHQLHIHDLCH